MFIKKGNVIKNSWWSFGFKSLLWCCQSEEDVGSAGEQPARNKIDAYTKKGVERFVVQPLLFLVSHMSKKNSFLVG